MEGQGEQVVAPKGAETYEHRLADGARVRLSAGSVYEVGGREVALDHGLLWVRVPEGTAPVDVVHGSVRASTGGGACMVEAGVAGEALLVVTAGTVTLGCGMDTIGTLGPGDAAMLDPLGAVSTLDKVGEEELASDPWVVANRALDVRAGEQSTAGPYRDEAVVIAQVLAALEATRRPDRSVGRSVRRTADPAVEVPEWFARVAAASDGSDDPDGVDRGVPPPPTPPSPELADGAEPASRGRSRWLQIVGVVLLVALGALVVSLVNRDDGPEAAPARLGTATSVTAGSTTESSGSSRPASSPATSAPVPVEANLASCAQRGNRLTATGTASGGPPDSTSYRVSLEVVSADGRSFGAAKVTVPVPPGRDAAAEWRVDIDLAGNASEAEAVCQIAGVVVLP